MTWPIGCASCAPRAGHGPSRSSTCSTPTRVDLPYQDLELTEFEGIEPEDARRLLVDPRAISRACRSARESLALREAVAPHVRRGGRRVPLRDGPRRRPPTSCAPSSSIDGARREIEDAARAPYTSSRPSLLLGLLAAVLPWFIHPHRQAAGRGRCASPPWEAHPGAPSVRCRRGGRPARPPAARAAQPSSRPALPLAFARPVSPRSGRICPRRTTAARRSAVIVLDDFGEACGASRARAGESVLLGNARRPARARLARRAPVTRVDLFLALVPRLRGHAPRPSPSRPPTAAACSRPLDAANLLGPTRGLRRRASGARRRFLTTAPARGAHHLRRHRPAGDGVGRRPRPADRARATAAPPASSSSTSRVPGRTARRSSRSRPSPPPQEGRRRRGHRRHRRGPRTSPTRPVRKLGLTLRLDHADVARGFIDIPARGARTQTIPAHARGAGGSAEMNHTAEVTIDHDLFTLDDVRRRRAVEGVARPCAPSSSTAIRGRCAPRTRRSSSRRPLRAGGGGVSITTAAARRGSRRRRSSDTPRCSSPTSAKPTDELAAALVRYVRARAAALFISVGDPRRRRRLERPLQGHPAPTARPQAHGLGPRPAASPRGEDRRPAPRRASRAARPSSPAARELPRERATGSPRARFLSSFMLLEPVPDAPGRSVVLRYENGAPGPRRLRGRPAAACSC